MVNPVINISIQQGSDFEETFQSTESNGSTSNLTGFTGEAKMKKHQVAHLLLVFPLVLQVELEKLL